MRLAQFQYNGAITVKVLAIGLATTAIAQSAVTEVDGGYTARVGYDWPWRTTLWHRQATRP